MDTDLDTLATAIYVSTDDLLKARPELVPARNRAIGELALECPPSLVAQALGYSPEVAFLHADKAAEPWARYAGRRISSP